MMKLLSLLYLAKIPLDTVDLPNSGTTDAPSSDLKIILSIVSAVAGSIALLIIVISGYSYIIAAGDPSKMAQAKKSILYAVIGLVVSLAAFSIVTFAIKGIS